MRTESTCIKIIERVLNEQFQAPFYLSLRVEGIFTKFIVSQLL